MQVSLPPELEKLVRERIDRGDCEHPDALIQEAVQREAVHRFIEEDEIDVDRLKERLRIANEEIDRGGFYEFDEHPTR